MKHRMNFEGIQRYLEVFFPRIIWPQNTGADLGLNLVLKVYRPSTSGKYCFSGGQLSHWFYVSSFLASTKAECYFSQRKG